MFYTIEPPSLCVRRKFYRERVNYFLPLSLSLSLSHCLYHCIKSTRRNRVAVKLIVRRIHVCVARSYLLPLVAFDIFSSFKPISIRARRADGSRFRRAVDIDLHARGFDRLRASNLLPDGAGGEAARDGGREGGGLAFPV